VKEHKIIFPDGGSYRLLVLPQIETMTPELLKKIESLVRAGANIVGGCCGTTPEHIARLRETLTTL